jgi:hypothetical protein
LRWLVRIHERWTRHLTFSLGEEPPFSLIHPAMKPHIEPETVAPDAWLTNWYRHPLVRRVFWFGVGGVLSIAGNYGLLQLFMHGLGVSQGVGYAFSLALMTIFTFAWSYLVNFRTSAAWRLCAQRYLATLLFCTGINYVLARAGFRIFPGYTAAVIAAVQVGVAFIKFGIFHFWVFPGKTIEPALAKN